MKKTKGKRGRKPKYATEAERKEAHAKSQAKSLLKKQGEAQGTQEIKTLSAIVKKLANDIETIKWELFGRKKWYS